MKTLLIIGTLVLISSTSCNNMQIKEEKIDRRKVTKISIEKPIRNSVTVSVKFQPNFIVGDFDGDKLTDSVQMVIQNKNGKYGLRFIFGNKKIEYLGLGKEVLV